VSDGDAPLETDGESADNPQEHPAFGESIMRWVLSPALFLVALATIPGQSADPAVKTAPVISWKKTTIDAKFRSEGVAVADVNRDGKLDILTGEMWYEAPDWKPHEISKPGDYGNGLGGYSHVFACWADDINSDGWADLIVIDFPGEPCYWLENPKGKEGHWKKHVLWHSACNETPLYVDLFGKGQRVLVMAFQPKGKKPDGNEGQMAWFAPGKNPEELWTMHPISEPTTMGKTIPGTMRYAHGLGVGDLNRDGRADVMCSGGWWEQPAKDGGNPWKFHAANLGEACADMFAIDVDGDGKNDVVSSSAHKFGIWAHLNKSTGDKDTFNTTVLFKDLVSETHAMHYVDIDGDGLKDLVTGKRWWSHGRSEPGSDKPAMIFWFKCSEAKDGVSTFTPQVIDDNSGIGTQFEIIDINKDGTLDIVVSNKKGVHLIVQERK